MPGECTWEANKEARPVNSNGHQESADEKKQARGYWASQAGVRQTHRRKTTTARQLTSGPTEEAANRTEQWLVIQGSGARQKVLNLARIRTEVPEAKANEGSGVALGEEEYE